MELDDFPFPFPPVFPFDNTDFFFDNPAFQPDNVTVPHHHEVPELKFLASEALKKASIPGPLSEERKVLHQKIAENEGRIHELELE